MSQKVDKTIELPPALEAAIWSQALATVATWDLPNMVGPQLDTACHNLLHDLGRSAWALARVLRTQPNGIALGPEHVGLALENGRLVIKT